MSKRRRIGSIKSELLKKSREAVLAAVQIFNNPNITFKAESYIVLMIIGWTYLLHAYYRGQKIEYRYFKQRGKRRKFDTTSNRAHKYWELERCINDKESPIDHNTANNLRFVVGLRHEIEHKMTTRIDDLLSARFQACCLNYNHYVKALFGEQMGIDRHLSFSLQFSRIDSEQKDLISEYSELPANIQSYLQNFDEALSEEEYASEQYAYRILFVPKTANRRGQADRVVEFVRSDSELAKTINAEYAIIKETEKTKLLPSQIVKKLNDGGFPSFGMHQHTQLWKKLDAKNPEKGFGTLVAEKHWHWYETWYEYVLTHCAENAAKYQ